MQAPAHPPPPDAGDDAFFERTLASAVRFVGRSAGTLGLFLWRPAALAAGGPTGGAKLALPLCYLTTGLTAAAVAVLVLLQGGPLAQPGARLSTLAESLAQVSPATVAARAFPCLVLVVAIAGGLARLAGVRCRATLLAAVCHATGSQAMLFALLVLGILCGLSRLDHDTALYATAIVGAARAAQAIGTAISRYTTRAWLRPLAVSHALALCLTAATPVCLYGILAQSFGFQAASDQSAAERRREGDAGLKVFPLAEHADASGERLWVTVAMTNPTARTLIVPGLPRIDRIDGYALAPCAARSGETPIDANAMVVLPPDQTRIVTWAFDTRRAAGLPRTWDPVGGVWTLDYWQSGRATGAAQDPFVERKSEVPACCVRGVLQARRAGAPVRR